MRSRVVMLCLAAGLLLAIAACARRAPVAEVPTRAPTRTARPTFTYTPRPATATPEAAAPVAVVTQPTATSEPPTAVPTPQKAMLKANGVANVRSGPGVVYARIGQAQAGQEFEITGKNAASDWWQVNYEGQAGWIAASMVTANDVAANVAVAQAPEPPPTPRPQPQAQAQPRPQPQPQPQSQPQPQPQPQPTFPYASQGFDLYPNPVLTIRCQVWDNRKSNALASAFLRVTGPASPPAKAFGSIVELANGGMAKTMQYLTNKDCKIEIQPYVEGTYTAQVVDGAGNAISDPITFTPGGDTREVLVKWHKR